MRRRDWTAIRKDRSMADDTEWKPFVTRLRNISKAEACAAVLGDPAGEAAVFRDAALCVMFATNLHHRVEGHDTRLCEDCDKAECVAGVAAAAVFIEAAQTRAYRRPRPVPERSSQ
jgi:hypothetical protein